jgi:hypothetical protein
MLVWFIKQLLQWFIIAAIACAPFLLPSFHPIIAVFATIVIIGLIKFGLFDPATSIRRALVSGTSAALGVYLMPSLVNALKIIRPYLSDYPVALATLDFVATITSEAPFIQVIAILIIILIAYVAQLYFENNSTTPKKSDVGITLTTPTAIISGSGIGKDIQIYGHLNITNRSGREVYISELFANILFSRHMRLESYPVHNVDEITQVHHFVVSNDKMETVKFVLRDCPPFLSRFIQFLKSSHILGVLNVPMKITLHGSPEINFQSIPLRAKF